MESSSTLPPGVTLVQDVSVGAWLTAKLDATRPAGRRRDGSAHEPETTAQTAQTSAVNTVVPSGYAAYVEISLRDGRGAQLRAQEVMAQHTDGGERCYSAIWEGWPCSAPWSGAPQLVIPDDFWSIVFAHDFADTAAAWSITGGDETLRWPENRAWVVGRPVDSDAVYVACDRDLARALVGSGRRDTRLVDPTDPHLDDDGPDDTDD